MQGSHVKRGESLIKAKAYNLVVSFSIMKIILYSSLRDSEEDIMIVAREPPTLGLTQSDKPYLKQYGIALAYLHQPKTQVSTLVTQPLIPTSALGKAKLKEVRVDEALNPITTLTSWLNLPKSWSGSHFMRYCACPRRRETHSRKLSWTHQSFATLIPSTVSNKECFTCHYHVGHHLHCRGHGH